jgi:SRSO17 transposase
MIERALEAGVPFGWVTADELYGNDTKFRLWLEAVDVPHVVAVPKSAMVVSFELLKVRVHRLVAELPDTAWKRLSSGAGTKGARVSDWAVAGIRPLRRREWGHWLLARRSIADPDDIAYYVCFGPAGTTLEQLVRVAGARWAVEECFQTAKNETGLDHYQVRGYQAWYRHITLSMTALAFLVITREITKKGAPHLVPITR